MASASPAWPEPELDVTFPSPSPRAPDQASGVSAPEPWADELAERVARFKQKRSKLGSETDRARSNLEFDFERHAGEPAPEASEVDVVLGQRSSHETGVPTLDSIPLESGSGAPGLRSEGTEEWALEVRRAQPSGLDEVEPLEIVLGSGGADDGDAGPGLRHPGRLAAPIGRRLAAGILDSFILSVAAAVFGVVFLASGGRLPGPPYGFSAPIGALAVAFFVLLYFWLFTAVTSATPGQSMMNLRVRTLDDRRPDGPASRRRALGYLISAAALMVGFVWAVFDGDGLTWHDRMSGTCLAESRGPSEHA